MGLLESLINAASASQPKAEAASSGLPGGLDPQMLIGLVGTLIQNAGGLQGILAKLQAAGLGEAAQSWVGTGANQPVTGNQLGDALGPDLMGAIAAQLGGSRAQASGTLADLLPGLIDQLTPQGQLPADNGMGALGGLLGAGAGNAGDLMGALGGLLQPRR